MKVKLKSRKLKPVLQTLLIVGKQIAPLMRPDSNIVYLVRDWLAANPKYNHLALHIMNLATIVFVDKRDNERF